MKKEQYKPITYENNSLNLILFGNQRKYLKKLNLIIFTVICIYSAGILYMSDFLSNNNIIESLYFAVGLILMIIFVGTGYKWLGQKPIVFNSEKIWFFIMLALGLIMPFFRFVVINNIKYVFIPIFMYLMIILIHALWVKIKYNQRNMPWYKKYIGILTTTYSELLILIAYLFYIGNAEMNRTIIVFGGILLFINLVMVILTVYFKDVSLKFFVPISSMRVILIAFLSGILLWALKVFIFNFKVGAISGVTLGVQVIIFVWVLIILFYGKHDFSKNYIKSYIVNFAFFIQLILTLGSSNVIGQMQVDDSSFVNILFLSISAIAFYAILIFKNILRSNRYNTLDVSMLFILSISILALSLLENAKLFDALRKFNFDSGILGIGAFFNGINLIYVAFDWFRFSRRTERTKTWA